MLRYHRGLIVALCCENIRNYFCDVDDENNDDNNYKAKTLGER